MLGLFMAGRSLIFLAVFDLPSLRGCNVSRIRTFGSVRTANRTNSLALTRGVHFVCACGA